MLMPISMTNWQRIKQSRSYNWNGSTTWQDNNQYDTDYSFDGNGNLTHLKRRHGGTVIDDINYHYHTSGGKITT